VAVSGIHWGTGTPGGHKSVFDKFPLLSEITHMPIGFVDFQGIPVQNWFPNSVQTGPNRSL